MQPFPLWPVVVTAVLTLTACAPKSPVTEQPEPIIPASPPFVDVVHTARYTLVSLAPDDALRYPLRQIASHTLPVPKKGRKLPTRGDALHRWLTGTGYGLCLPVTEEARQLSGSPLPDIQRSPGPLRVEDALKIIAGPAWSMTVDEITRTVCFQRAPVVQRLS
ncbi:PFGI-1 class ICE element type IV pilus protein PilL2 [Erwinia psidii]|uniref:PFGI-1 class ICE element type IV pilus protein PilL2 n=1 Tax=Erwinia psidii TaxID=69224 RepID=UPI00226B6AEF|nr:response regulator [Erwinia psidii]